MSVYKIIEEGEIGQARSLSDPDFMSLRISIERIGDIGTALVLRNLLPGGSSSQVWPKLFKMLKSAKRRAIREGLPIVFADVKNNEIICKCRQCGLREFQIPNMGDIKFFVLNP